MQNERREKVKVALSASERNILESKKKKYGYQHLSTYIRDACIYENIIYEDLSGKQEIIQMTSSLIELVGDFTMDIHRLMKIQPLSKSDLHMLQHQNDQLLNELQSLKREVIQKLNITYQKKHMRQRIKQECLQLEEEENASHT